MLKIRQSQGNLKQNRAWSLKIENAPCEINTKAKKNYNSSQSQGAVVSLTHKIDDDQS